MKKQQLAEKLMLTAVEAEAVWSDLWQQDFQSETEAHKTACEWFLMQKQLARAVIDLALASGQDLDAMGKLFYQAVQQEKQKQEAV